MRQMYYINTNISKWLLHNWTYWSLWKFITFHLDPHLGTGTKFLFKLFTKLLQFYMHNQYWLITMKRGLPWTWYNSIFRESSDYQGTQSFMLATVHCAQFGALTNGSLFSRFWLISFGKSVKSMDGAQFLTAKGENSQN